MEQRVRTIGLFVKGLGVQVFKHDIASLSAKICFYAIFSMFPLLILVIYGTSLIVPNEPVVKLLLQVVQPYYPDVPNATQFIERNLNHLETVGARVSIVSGAMLIWSATSAFIAVQQSLDEIFEIEEQRSFVARRIVAFSMLFMLVTVAVICSIALTVYPILASHGSFGPVFLTWVSRLHGLTRILYPLSLFVTCFVFYRFLPSRRVDINSVILGSLVTTILLDLARTLFVIYASHLVTYQFIYGSLTVVILLVLWMYVALIILLFGAEIAAAVEKIANGQTEGNT